MKVKHISSGRGYAQCKYHEDKNPSVVIDLDGPYKGFWHCFSCGRSGKIKDKEFSKLKINSRKLVDKINWKILAEDYRLMILPQNLTYIESLLISSSLLIGWDGQAFTIPMRNECNEIIGIQRRFRDGFKCCVNGSLHGLFIPQIEWDINKPLYITEGCSDLAVLLHCGYQGIGKYNSNSCKEMVYKWQTKNGFHTLNTIIVADSDDAGVRGAFELCKNVGPVKIVPKPHKDLRQMFEKTDKETVRRFLSCN